MFDAYLQKVVMNGSVPDMEDIPGQSEVRDAAETLVETFYRG